MDVSGSDWAWILVVVLILSVVPCMASAQQVYKCIENNQTIYQSMPCSGSAPVKTWQAAPVSEASRADELRIERTRQEVRARNRRDSAGYATGGVVSAQKPSGCEAAKAARASAFKTAGHKRTFKMTSYWDNYVADACK